MKYTKDEIKRAYLKFKTHVYYDTTELFQRKQIAIFETGLDENGMLGFPSIYNMRSDIFETFSYPTFEEKFEAMANSLNGYDEEPKFFDHFLDKINIITLPKKFTSIQKKNKYPDNFLTNKREDEDYTVERATVFVDLPVELHIISVLWIMEYGYALDKGLDNSCVGNRLILTKDEGKLIEGTGLFKPYFNQYQKWRDNAVEEAQHKLSKGENVALLNLDIKDYFYSVRLDFKKIEQELGIRARPTQNLHRLFKEIHFVFTKKLFDLNVLSEQIKKDIGNRVVLPIGMPSSYVLANWYLKEFDTRITQKLKPVYYSRYVDDILIVVPNPDFNFRDRETCESIKFDFEKYKTGEKAAGEEITFKKENVNPIELYILESFHPILKLVDFPDWLKSMDNNINEPKKIFKIACTPDCYIQSDKTLVYYFDNNESTAVIDKLKQELEERSSEFRDFPEGNETGESFDEHAYHLIFDGTEGKIRTLKDYKENRYGLSVFLANRIFAALRRVKKVDKKESEKLLKLFKGQNTVEYYRLWEKILTYFLVNDDKDGFISFYKHTIEQIKKINYATTRTDAGITSKSLQDSLLKYFDIALELTLALNPYFVKPGTKSGKELEIAQNRNKRELDMFHRVTATSSDSFYITRFRRSNLVRHYYVSHPLLNYTKAARRSKLNLIDRHLPKDEFLNDDSLNFWDHSLDNSPRRVKFWECCIAVATKRLLTTSRTDGVQDERYFNTKILGNDISGDVFYLDEAFELYERINAPHNSVLINSADDRKKQFFDITKTDICKVAFDPSISINEIRVNTDKVFDQKPKISFANMALNYDYFLSSLRGEPELNHDRFKVFSHLLNESRKEKADMLLLPECSVPYELTSSFAKYAERSQMLIVAGLEHWLVDKISHNFIVTILPVVVNGINDAVVVYRLKNHYSLHEEEDVRGNQGVVPKPSIYRYDLFNWKGLYFAPYYCAELADIYHRSIFRSKVDLIVASEWNRDTPYFSNIVESLSRDLHAYVAQVNASQFGDSRLTQPSETAIKDLLKLKGGINHTILIGQIDLDALREFQRKYYELTKNEKNYKPVPPDINRNDVKKRIKNKKIY